MESATRLIADLAHAAQINDYLRTLIRVSNDGITAVWETPYGVAQSGIVTLADQADYRYRVMFDDECVWEVGLFPLCQYGRSDPEAPDCGPQVSGPMWERNVANMVSNAVQAIRESAS
ncbi:hypothetical protein ACEK07_46100 [Alcanivoracaceae bacterium MT1]